MRIKRSARFSLCEKIFTRTMVIPRTWIRKEMVFYSRIQTTRSMGQSCREQMMIKFAESRHPVFPSTSPLSRGVLKSKGGGKLSMHFCADGETVETVFRTIIFLLISSVFTEQSQICIKNLKPAMLEQGDLLWQDNLTQCSCQV